MKQHFNRTSQDVGNIVALEHVNTRVSDQSTAHLFYVSGMGFTREPYIDFGMRNMWINLGRQQFHLPVGEPQVLRGRTGIVVPSLAELQARLERVAPLLEGTRFGWRDENDRLEVTCPWGNVLEVHEAGAFGSMGLGMPFVRFDAPVGSAPGIVGFYREILGAPAAVVKGSGAPLARVSVGSGQAIEYQETSGEIADYDKHHIAIYVADFSGPHGRLVERGILSEESDESQYRFQSIVDPDSGEELYEIEHEVRSMRHPMYGRHLLNRNPQQSNVGYLSGHDAYPV